MIRSVCIFGDSVARGVVLDEAKQRYVDSRSCFARLVAEASHIAVENFARFGCTVTKGSRVAQRHLEDAARARMELEDVRRENERLRRELAQLRAGDGSGT